MAPILVGRQQREEVLLESLGVVDDVAAGGEEARGFELPACVSGECEVGVPDDVAGPAEAAKRVIREPLAGQSGSVPEADDARVVEDVRVPGAARVTGEDRQPDRVNGELRVRVGVEDVLSDPTGPELADASGWRDEQDQPRLPRARVEQRSQLPDVAQICELPGTAWDRGRRPTLCARPSRLLRSSL